MAGGLIASVPFSLRSYTRREIAPHRNRVLCNVRSYNRALSPTKIQALYHHRYQCHAAQLGSPRAPKSVMQSASKPQLPTSASRLTYAPRRLSQLPNPWQRRRNS